MSLKDYWIDEIQKVQEFQAIADAIDPEITDINTETENLLDDQFIQDATENGIARREKMLNIQPFADDTLETRRFRVGVKWNNQLPYTYRQLEKKLTDLVGLNGYTIVLDNGAYTLTVRVSLGQKRMLQDAERMVDNMSPQNLVLTVDLLYNKYSDLAGYTYNYLATKTYDQLRNEVLY
jgi:hypothetical protein